MTKFRLIFIPFAILSLLLSFSISADETMEEVVVMGKPIKASQQSAIEAKRLARVRCRLLWDGVVVESKIVEALQIQQCDRRS